MTAIQATAFVPAFSLFNVLTLMPNPEIPSNVSYFPPNGVYSDCLDVIADRSFPLLLSRWTMRFFTCPVIIWFYDGFSFGNSGSPSDSGSNPC